MCCATVQPLGSICCLAPRLSSPQPLQFFLTVTDFNWVKTWGVYSPLQGPWSLWSAACWTCNYHQPSLHICQHIFIKSFKSLLLQDCSFSPSLTCSFWPCVLTVSLLSSIFSFFLYTLGSTYHPISCKELLAFQSSMEKCSFGWIHLSVFFPVCACMKIWTLIQNQPCRCSITLQLMGICQMGSFFKSFSYFFTFRLDYIWLITSCLHMTIICRNTPPLRLFASTWFLTILS